MNGPTFVTIIADLTRELESRGMDRCQIGRRIGWHPDVLTHVLATADEQRGIIQKAYPPARVPPGRLGAESGHRPARGKTVTKGNPAPLVWRRPD